jgi:predicted SAM-dependent methyltransferase
MQKIKSLIKKALPKDMINIYREIKRLSNAWPYRGNGVLCPCCGKTFRCFRDYKYNGNIQNKSLFNDYFHHTICPYCRSKSRHRITCNYFNEHKASLLPHPPPLDQNIILMFGAELSIKIWFQKNGYRYTTADLFDEDADMQVDIQKTPFPDETWSMIICNHVLEHVPDYQMALMELKRILKKDGILEITIPTDRTLKTVYEDPAIVSIEERIEKFGQFDHMRIFGNDFEVILQRAGFFVEVLEGDKMPAKIGPAPGPAKYDDNRVYICRK